MRGAGDRSNRKAMIDKDHPKLSIRRQSKLLDVNRNRLDPPQSKITEEDYAIMKIMDELYMAHPHYGTRNYVANLRDYGYNIGRGRARRLMRIMGIESLAPKPNTSKPSKENKIFPYLLRNRKITKADEVWCTDITYLPMPKGHAYLIAVMDWHTRAVLSWKVSNTMDTRFCVEALEEALHSTGRKPQIFNTDQGSQFSSEEWINCLQNNDIQISMDGKGRWMDNVFIERLWRSIKYEKIRLYSYDTVHELRDLVDEWMMFYNHKRRHQHLNEQTPWSQYNHEQLKNAA